MKNHRQTSGPGTKFAKGVAIALVLAAAALFVAHFGGPNILRWYVETGVGDCGKIPLLCKVPEEKIEDPAPDRGYVAGCVVHRFTDFSIAVPKGFTVVRETVKKVYYKKHRRLDKGAVIYLLYKPPGFFIGLFPRLKQQGIIDDYAFIRRTMYATSGSIRNLSDAFFVIMKSVFLPDLGEQDSVKMAEVRVCGKRGFLNYNLSASGNYFECNLFDADGHYFKVYIKDKSRVLGLKEVLAVISTLQANG